MAGAARVNFLYVYDGHWPHNATRVSKQISVLISAGHSVTILSRSRPGQALNETNGKLSVVRLPSWKWRLADKLATYPVFLNPVWVSAIRSAASAIKADAIIVRDLPLAPAALHVARKMRIPAHYDMAEVYPAALDSILSHEAGIAIKIVRTLKLAEAIEKWVVHRAQSTFVVSEDSRERCIALGVPADRVVLVGNTPANPEALLSDWPIPDDLADAADRPMILFVGNIFADRGLRYVIDAMPAVLRSVPPALFVVVGDGRECPLLKAQVAEQSLQQHVRFLGWKHHDTHPAYLRHAQVGVLPFVATEHIRITLANKLFDYMGASLPVVASDVPSMRRIIDDASCGMLVEPENAAALADVLVKLLLDRSLRQTLGTNGREAVSGRYAWSNDASRFLAAVERPSTHARR